MVMLSQLPSAVGCRQSSQNSPLLEELEELEELELLLLDDELLLLEELE